METELFKETPQGETELPKNRQIVSYHILTQRERERHEVSLSLCLYCISLLHTCTSSRSPLGDAPRLLAGSQSLQPLHWQQQQQQQQQQWGSAAAAAAVAVAASSRRVLLFPGLFPRRMARPRGGPQRGGPQQHPRMAQRMHNLKYSSSSSSREKKMQESK